MIEKSESNKEFPEDGKTSDLSDFDTKVEERDESDDLVAEKANEE